MNDISGFQRMRRLQAAKAAKEAENTNTRENENNSQNEQDLPPNDEVQQPKDDLTAESIEEMDIDQLKAELDKLEIAYAHNTGEAKLREKLLDAIN